MALYWVPDAEDVWKPGPADKEGRELVLDRQLDGVDDICTLPSVSQGALLHTVRTRFARQLIYTRVARILIAVNPFASLPLYSSQILDSYAKARDSVDLPPHIYGVGRDAISGLQTGSCNQAVLISGESGAGKTESAKLVLSFVAEALGGERGGVEEKVLRTNPVLEAFGNAMTVRNNNSSRFGKWLDLRFSKSLDILGCSVASYLLEVTRVCTQSAGERCFHIFFMLLQARRSNDLGIADLKLDEPKMYRYLNGGELVAPGVDDGKHWEELKDSMSSLGFSNKEQKEVVSILGGILTLGNCEFEEDQGGQSKMLSDAPLNHASQLLGVEPENLQRVLLWRNVTVGKDSVATPLHEDQCRFTRDAVSRLIYGRMFLWLIQRMNAELASGSPGEGEEESPEATPEANPGQRLLGVLDIAGFEKFERNSLEQLLINLSNEHLQQQFNSSMFKSELEDYLQEGVLFADKFADNSDVLELLDGKGGVLDILDEEAVVPKATDASYTVKIVKNLASHSRMVVPKFSGESFFTVKHYAGQVTYQCDGFLYKNTDKVGEDLVNFLSTSSLDVLHNIADAVGNEMAGKSMRKSSDGPAKPGSKKAKSVSAQFRVSLRSLMQKVSSADPHYIRCIKPNLEKVPDKITCAMLLDQLLLNGVLEVIRVRAVGFSTRTLMEDFVYRYRVIPASVADRCSVSQDGALKATTKLLGQLVTALGSEVMVEGSYAVGKTKVFLKEGATVALEAARNDALLKVVLVIQRFGRGFLVRLRSRAAGKLKAQCREWLQAVGVGGRSALIVKLGTAEAARSAVESVDIILSCAKNRGYRDDLVAQAEVAQRRLGIEIDCLEELSSFQASLDVVGMERIQARGRDLGFASLPLFEEIQVRTAKLQTQLPLVRGMQAASQEPSPSLERLRSATAAVNKAGLGESPEGWLPELGASELIAEVRRLQAEAEAELSQRRAQQVEEDRSGDPDNEIRKAIEADARQAIEADARAQQAAITHELSSCIEQAVDECDAIALERLLSEALRSGVPADSLAGPRRLLQQMQTEDFLLPLAVKESQAATDAEVPSTSALRKLQNISLQIRKVVGEIGPFVEAIGAAQEAVRRRTTVAPMRRSTPDEEFEELELIEGLFGELWMFGGLKSTRSWRGHKESASIKARGPWQREVMLSHSREPIREALTQVPDSLEPQAVQNFRNLLVVMCDRPGQECVRVSTRQAVIDLAASEPRIVDEIYVQVMKQMTSNSSVRSCSKGWELLVSLCQAVQPSAELRDFVIAFVRRSTNSSEDSGTHLTGARSSIEQYLSQASRHALLCLDALQQRRRTNGRRTRATIRPSRFFVALSEPLAMLEASPLVRVQDGRVVLAQEGLDAIGELPEDATICPVVFMGHGVCGMGALASQVVGAVDAFPSAFAQGVDVVAAPVPQLLKDAGLESLGSEREHLLVFFCQDLSGASVALRVVAGLIGLLAATELVFVADGMLSEEALQKLDTSLEVRAHVRQDPGSSLPPRRLIFAVNNCVQSYGRDALVHILEAHHGGAQADVRDHVKGAFPDRCLQVVPLTGAPSYEERIAEFRKVVLERRSRLAMGGVPIRRDQLHALLELIVANVQDKGEVSMAAVRRSVIFDSFLAPLAVRLAASAGAAAALNDDAHADVMRTFEAEARLVEYPGLVGEARSVLDRELRGIPAGSAVAAQKPLLSPAQPRAQGRGLLQELIARSKSSGALDRGPPTPAPKDDDGASSDGEWWDSGMAEARLDWSMEGHNDLPVVQDRLQKVNPNKSSSWLSLGLRSQQERECLLKEAHLLWWKPVKAPEDAVDGFINFFVHSSEVLADRNPTTFTIRPVGANGWQGPVSFTGGRFREFTFNCQNSSLDRDTWVAAVQKHITFAAGVRRQLGVSALTTMFMQKLTVGLAKS